MAYYYRHRNSKIRFYFEASGLVYSHPRRYRPEKAPPVPNVLQSFRQYHGEISTTYRPGFDLQLGSGDQGIFVLYVSRRGKPCPNIL